MAEEKTHQTDSPIVRAAKSGGAKGAATARRHLLERLGLDKHMSGFMDFVREQGVIGLAVGLVLGVQVKAVVDQLVASFVNPVIGLLLPGKGGLAEKTFTLSVLGKEAEFAYGAFIAVMISFVTVAAVVYFAIKGLKLDKLDKKKEKA
ncbi:MAG TPA: MscL family protein [Candidatus Limnocylindria bacterium]|nr:MscL family protein [Candidatus Limnocylindria bacterium]